MKRERIPVAARRNYLESTLVAALEFLVGPVTRAYGAMDGNPRDFYTRAATFTATHASGAVAIVTMTQNLRGESDPETYCYFTQIEVRGKNYNAIRPLVAALQSAFEEEKPHRVALPSVPGYMEDRLVEALECIVGPVVRSYGELGGNPRDTFFRHASFVATQANGTNVTIEMDQVLRGPDDPETHCEFREMDVRGPSEEATRAIVEKLKPALHAARYDVPRKRLRLNHVETRGDVTQAVFADAIRNVIGFVHWFVGDLSGNPRDMFERDAMIRARHDDATIITVSLRQSLWSPTDETPWCHLRDIDVRGPSAAKNLDLAEKLRAALEAIGVTVSSPVEEDAPPLSAPPTLTPPLPPSPPIVMAPPEPAPTAGLTIRNFAWDHHVVNGEIVEALMFAQTWIERGEQVFSVAPKLRALYLTGIIGDNDYDGPLILERLREALACPWMKRLTALATTDISLIYRESMWDMVESHSLHAGATEILLAADLHHLEVMRIGWQLTDEERATIEQKFGCTLLPRGEETGGPRWLF